MTDGAVVTGLTPAQVGQAKRMRRLGREIGSFAEHLIGEPLWDHQLELARSPARFRLVRAGRQVGKSRTSAVIALHTAFNQKQQVLIISAGEDSAKQLLSEVAGLAQSPWLAATVLEDDSAKVVLSNGSVIRCVPASHRRARSKSIDTLILDEACFIAQEIWDAAKFTILARPGSRIVLASTPYGRQDKFFAQMERHGEAGRAGYASFYWPSSVSPLVDQALLEEWAETDPPRVYRREVLAEWVDDAGAYFTAAELESATCDEPLLSPAQAHTWGATVVGGVDFGFAQDANTLAVVGALPDRDQRDRLRYRVLWVEEAFATPYADWVESVCATAGKFQFAALACETNGVGGMPVQVLSRLMWEAGRGDVVVPVTTSARVKEDAYGFCKLLIQQDRLEIPRAAVALLRQLAGLEFETTESGVTRIAVPDRIGHDDCAVALALAVLQLQVHELIQVEPQVVGLEDLWSAEQELEYRYVNNLHEF